MAEEYGFVGTDVTSSIPMLIIKAVVPTIDGMMTDRTQSGDYRVMYGRIPLYSTTADALTSSTDISGAAFPNTYVPFPSLETNWTTLETQLDTLNSRTWSVEADSLRLKQLESYLRTTGVIVGELPALTPSS